MDCIRHEADRELGYHNDDTGGYDAAPGCAILAYIDIGGSHAHPLVAATCADEWAAVRDHHCSDGHHEAWDALASAMLALGLESVSYTDDGFDGVYLIGRMRNTFDEAQ